MGFPAQAILEVLYPSCVDSGDWYMQALISVLKLSAQICEVSVHSIMFQILVMYFLSIWKYSCKLSSGRAYILCSSKVVEFCYAIYYVCDVIRKVQTIELDKCQIYGRGSCECMTVGQTTYSFTTLHLKRILSFLLVVC